MVNEECSEGADCCPIDYDALLQKVMLLAVFSNGSYGGMKKDRKGQWGYGNISPTAWAHVNMPKEKEDE